MNTHTQAALDIARKVGEMLKSAQYRNLEITYKGEIDPVTSMDKRSEDMITSFLREHYPDYGIVAEEGSTSEEDSEYLWYIDPLDGTVNYAHGIPWYSVSIGLYRNGTALSGVIYHPAFNEMFYAELEGGAYLNGERLKVTDREDLKRSLVSTGFPYYVHEDHDGIVRRLEVMLTAVQGVRRFGSAALDLAYVASGRYDGFWEEGLKPWDTAAGVLLVQEAGGKVTTYENGDYSFTENTIVASNGRVHGKMVDLLGCVV